jgi:hypothetical protein
LSSRDKKDAFDLMFIKKICPSFFDSFEFHPAVGASGGSIIIWKSNLFTGIKIFENDYCVSVEFVSNHNNDSLILSNIYAPCTAPGKRAFLQWFKNIHMPDNINWPIVGDFNLYRSPNDRNRPRGGHLEMYLFNEAIYALGLVELPLKGRRYTWSNKQLSPLLERLDWFFTNVVWTITYPNTYASSLVNETSDHTPCVITISTAIPKTKIYRFENFWMEHDELMPLVAHVWDTTVNENDMAKIITAKFKILRKALKDW